MKNSTLTVIAGPCSVDEHNIDQILSIADITVKNRENHIQKAIAGTRVVGIKSRTELAPDGSGMGIDYETFLENQKTIVNGGTVKNLTVSPSVKYAEKIVKKTNMLVATELMDPMIQCPQYEGKIPKGKLMFWNPSVQQLGWPVLDMTTYAAKNGWSIGLKNGKWLGDTVRNADSEDYAGQTTMEKTWIGLTKYAHEAGENTLLIHRGVDVAEKDQYRNVPVHTIAQRVKHATGRRLLFDPSHAYGPKMKQKIVPAVIDAMKMQMSQDEYLYDGIMIEVGDSQTDTDQHITVDELEYLVKELAQFRDLEDREGV